MIDLKCDLHLNQDIAGLIHAYSKGEWETCFNCEQSVDSMCGKWEGIQEGYTIQFYCNDCVGPDTAFCQHLKDQAKGSIYTFTD